MSFIMFLTIVIASIGFCNSFYFLIELAAIDDLKFRIVISSAAVSNCAFGISLLWLVFS
jgi:hypothetical protein